MRKLKLISFLIFIIFSLFSCDPKKANPSLEEILLYEITETPRTFPIDILVTNEFDETQKKAVKTLKHEFGHTIGMEHIKDNYLALMNLGANQGNLSKYDMIMFCSMYKCKN